MTTETATTSKQRNRPTIPARTMLEQIHRLGLTPSQCYEILGLASSTLLRAKRDNVVPKAYALAVEALIRRQSRDSTNWALLCLTHGSAQVTAIDEPQEILVGGKPFWLIEKPSNGKA